MSSSTSSVTTLASQIGTSVPAAASTTGAVNKAITTDRSGGERVGVHDNGELPFGCKQIATAHSSEDGLRADSAAVDHGCDRRIEQRSDNREKRPRD